VPILSNRQSKSMAENELREKKVGERGCDSNSHQPTVPNAFITVSTGNGVSLREIEVEKEALLGIAASLLQFAGAFTVLNEGRGIYDSSIVSLNALIRDIEKVIERFTASSDRNSIDRVGAGRRPIGVDQVEQPGLRPPPLVKEVHLNINEYAEEKQQAYDAPYREIVTWTVLDGTGFIKYAGESIVALECPCVVDCHNDNSLVTMIKFMLSRNRKGLQQISKRAKGVHHACWDYVVHCVLNDIRKDYLSHASHNDGTRSDPGCCSPGS
jgi:hypothetical protein